MSRQEGSEFAQQVGALFMECSAKTREGVKAAFDEIVHRMARQRRASKKEESEKRETVGLSQPSSQASGCC